jgi:hypothetical protein
LGDRADSPITEVASLADRSLSAAGFSQGRAATNVAPSREKLSPLTQ